MSNRIKPDDGTTEWLDEVVMTRIRKGNQQQQQPQYPQQVVQRQQQNYQYKNYQYTTGGVKMLPGETVEQVNAAKEYAKKTYMRVPHAVGPLYAKGLGSLKENADALAIKKLGSEIQVNVDLDKITNNIGSTILTRFGRGDSQEAILGTMDPSRQRQVMQKMQQLQKGEWVAPNTLLPQQQQQQQQSSACKIIPGYPVFEQIQTNGFGTAKALVRSKGTITPQLSAVEFVVRGSTEAIVIMPNEASINLGLLQNDPSRNVSLVAIQAPPMTGLPILFVPKEAIANGMGGGRQIITDIRQRPMAPNQQFLHQSNHRPMAPNQQMINSNNQPNFGPKRTLLKS